MCDTEKNQLWAYRGGLEYKNHQFKIQKTKTSSDCNGAVQCNEAVIQDREIRMKYYVESTD